MKKKDEVTEYILNNIDKGIWKPGTRILGECDIAERLGVCRNTVREALAELEKKNVIYKKTGSGSYVKNISPKKILILFDNQMRSYVKRNLFAKIANLIDLSPYEIEIVYVGEFESVNLENIGGIINIAEDTYAFNSGKSFIEKTKNIPFVNVLTYFVSETPSIVFNTASFYNAFFSLVKGHRDAVFFSFGLNALNEYVSEEYISDFYMDSYNICMQGVQSVISSLYKHVKISENYSSSETEKKLDEEFAKIKTPPYAVVFCDDVLYAKAYPLFEKYDQIFSNTKIITHSNGFNMETGPYRAVKVELDLDRVAQASLSLLVSLMNREPEGQKYIVIDAVIKNQ